MTGSQQTVHLRISHNLWKQKEKMHLLLLFWRKANKKQKTKNKLCIKSEGQSIGGHWVGSLGSRYFPISVFQFYLKDIRTTTVTVCLSSYIFPPTVSHLQRCCIFTSLH